MTRIVFLTPFDPRPAAMEALRAKHGGVERYVRMLSRELVSLGFSVQVIASGSRNLEVVDSGVEFRILKPWALPGGTPCFSWPPLILGSAAELFHVQATYPLLTESAPVFARIRDVPCVATCHFDIVGRSPKESSIASWYYKLAGRKAYSSYDRVIYSTEGYARESLSTSSVPRNRVRIVPMGIDPSKFRVLSNVAKEKTILFVGRLAWFKGVDVLVKAFSRHALGEGWRLRIVGDGPMRPSVESLIRRLGVHAELMSDVADEELARLYNAAAVTVLPSVAAQESFGMTLLESLACGVPVVASDWPGVREVAALSGLTVPPGDERALGSALREVASWSFSIAERRDLSQRIAKAYNWADVARRTADVYRELI